ncbi:MAG: MFS transporter, partial [Terriglobales bacterium]
MAKETISGAVAALQHRLAETFRSLRHRNFALYCGGIAASLTGSWMQAVAMGWLAFSLTGSAFMLGLVASASLIPSIALNLLGGWCAGRFDRKKILLVTQSIEMVQAFALAALTATGHIHPWQLVMFSAILGCLIAFELPARFALIAHLVTEKERLNAYSLDSFLFYTGRALGPAIGGLLLGAFGAAACFGLNGFSYLAELATLLAIRLTPEQQAATASGIKHALLFVSKTAEVRRVMLMVAVTCFTAVYLAMMPAFTARLHGDASTFGILVAASEFGALVASLWLANQGEGGGLLKRIGLAGAVLVAVETAFCFSTVTWLAAILLVPTGFMLTVVLMGSHGIVQLRAPDELRGVISSLFWMIALGG